MERTLSPWEREDARWAALSPLERVSLAAERTVALEERIMFLRDANILDFKMASEHIRRLSDLNAFLCATANGMGRDEPQAAAEREG